MGQSFQIHQVVNMSPISLLALGVTILLASSAHGVTDGSAGVVMSEYDHDRDGFVSAAELSDQWGWTEAKAQHHIDTFDEDGDGQINTAEFAHVLNMIENHIHA